MAEAPDGQSGAIRSIEWYFAYGSNMNPNRVAERGLVTKGCCGGVLSGFELAFDKGAQARPGVGHANINAQRGAQVEGLLHHLASADEILKMDPFEKAPINYGRDVVPVQLIKPEPGSPSWVWAWTYFANDAVKQPNLRPEADYLAHLLAGEQWLSEGYVRKLRTVQRCD